MVKAFLIKYSEIGIKGKNRYIFEDALRSRVAEKLKKCEGDFLVERENGRIYVEAKGEYDYDEVIGHLTKCFGIAHICPVVLVEDKTFENDSSTSSVVKKESTNSIINFQHSGISCKISIGYSSLNCSAS